MTPTEKTFRPSYRAAIHGCIASDTSYYDTFHLTWSLAEFKHALSTLCDPTEVSPTAVRYTPGTRICSSTLYASNCFPYDLIGPVQFVWEPLDFDVVVKEETKRTLIVFTHPSITTRVKEALTTACRVARDNQAKTIEVHSRELLAAHFSSYGFTEDRPNPIPLAQVAAEFNAKDAALRSKVLPMPKIGNNDGLCRFELIGPESGVVLYKLLRPANGSHIDKLEVSIAIVGIKADIQ